MGILDLQHFLNISPESLHMSVDSFSKNPLSNKVVTPIQEYLITVDCGPELQYQVGKRFSDFIKFDESMRSNFPGVAGDLGSVPSKLTILNKDETRKKAFNVYVEKLVAIVRKTQVVTTRDVILRKIAEFLRIPGTEESKTDESSIPRHSSLIEKAQITPRVGSCYGYLDVQFRQRPWKQYFCSLIASSHLYEEETKNPEADPEKTDQTMLDLYLFENEAVRDRQESCFTSVICLRGAELVTSKTVLELRYDNLDQPILLRCKDEKELSRWNLEIMQKLSGRVQVVPQTYPNCGVLYIKVGSLTGIKLPKPAVSVIKPHVYIQVSLPPFLYCTSIKAQNKTVDLDQEFIVPIANRFAKLQIDVMSFSSEGWLTQHPKRDSVVSFSIPVPYIALAPFNHGEICINLDGLLGKSQAIKTTELEAGQEASVTLQVEDWSSFGSIILKPPENYIEDLPVPKSMTMGKLKIAMKRIKRLLIFWKRFWGKFKMIQMWVYPKFSGFVMTVLVLVTLFMPSQYILPFFLGVFMMLVGICHPVGYYLIGDYLEKQFFSVKHRADPLPQVKTMKEFDEDKQKDMNNFTIDVRPVGFIEKYKILKKDLVELQVDLSRFSCWIEKVRK